MQLEHRGSRPRVPDSAYVAPNAVLCGDVTLGEDCRVLFGAVISAEGGPVVLGARCVVMENAVIRGSKRHPVRIGSSVLVGPRAYLTGCTVGDRCFLATGSTVFNGATLGDGAEVRVNGTVHLKTRLAAGATVPIGWVAVGDPAVVLSPAEHEEIWRVQEPLDFPGEVFGVPRAADGSTDMERIMQRYCRGLEQHRNDRDVER